MKSKLSNGWKEYQIGDIFDTYQPKTITAYDLNPNGKYLVFGANGIIGKYDKYNHEKSEVLITCRGATCGTVNLSKPRSWITGNSMVVTPKKEYDDKIEKLYVYYFLKSKNLKNIISGSAQPQITREPLKKLKFLLPTLLIQQKIVSILEKAEKAKEFRKEADKLTKDFLKAVFLDLFGDPKINNKKWSIVKINDCLESTQYGTSSKSNDKKKGYPIIGMNHISTEGEINLSKYNYVDISKEEFDKLKLYKGDVLFNRTNSPELIGKTACWNEDLLEAVVASYLVKLRMKNNCDPIFFTYLMNTAYFKELFYSSSKKAVNQANISPTLLKTFPMYLPPIHIQKQFSLIVNRIFKMKHHQKHSEEQIKNLFNNLIQKAFKGELVC